MRTGRAVGVRHERVKRIPVESLGGSVGGQQNAPLHISQKSTDGGGGAIRSGTFTVIGFGWSGVGFGFLSKIFARRVFVFS